MCRSRRKWDFFIACSALIDSGHIGRANERNALARTRLLQAIKVCVFVVGGRRRIPGDRIGSANNTPIHKRREKVGAIFHHCAIATPKTNAGGGEGGAL